MKKLRLTILLSAMLLLVSCIENDVPYPTVQPDVVSVNVSGAKSVSINSLQHTITIDLTEEQDIRSVSFNGISFGDGLTRLSSDIPQVLDLTTPYEFTLQTYQEYKWKLVATQTIDRYFTVDGQVGSSYIDDVNRRAIAYVSTRTPLSRITITSLKLGPRNITDYFPQMSEIRDFTTGVEMTVSCHGRSEEWHLFVEQSETVVDWVSVDAWTGAAWFSAAGIAGLDNGFRYREKGAEEWTVLNGDAIISDGGAFTAKADSLKPLTSYECIAFSGTNETAVREFTTEDKEQLPNSGFEVFSKCESSNYWSFFDPESLLWNSKWWDSGNVGSTTVGSSYSICNPDTEDKVEGNASSRMDSQYVVVKFAAGNMFSGEFAGLVGVQGGKVNFGRPFTKRPQALKLYLKYNCGVVDCVGSYPDGEVVAKGDKDRCQVFVALGDWDYHKYGGTPDSPVQVNTTDKSTFFNPKGDNVIAYGKFESCESTDGWIEVTIPLEYASHSRVPSHIIVSCAASKLGDYFTGSSASTLWVDDIKLIY